MKITRGDNPLNLIVHLNFRLMQLGFSEWLEVHALASKTSGPSNNLLLQSLRAKFLWIINQAKRLGLPPPHKLVTFGLTAEEKKRKRVEFIKEMFMTEDVIVDGMNKNLIPPLGAVPIEGLVIKEPESGIFYMNRNTDVVFQRERLSECEASESNVRRIQVKDIVKEVEDYLKTYSSVGMDISCWLYKFACKLDTLSSLLVQRDSDSDVEEDQRTNNEFIADLNAEYHERAFLANQKRFYKRSGRDEESMSLEDEGTTRIRAFMAIAKDEPSMGKADTRSGQWVDITMKKVHRLLSMIDSDDRKHVLDYTHVDLIYVEDQRKNMVKKYNLLKQELSLHKSELSNLKNIVSINCSLQNEVIRVNLENESLKDEISDLKKAIKK
ncbi:hypothetical protein Tco_1218650 [Tanacetum coccineum]